MKIICIGQNYREHIMELGSKVPEKPVFFCKPDTALLIRNRPFYIPDFSQELHYETELVLRICKVGKNIAPKFVPDYYDAYTLGFDFTARDIQRHCRQEGLPWEICKAFDNSAAIGQFIPKAEFPQGPDQLHFEMKKNGETHPAKAAQDRSEVCFHHHSISDTGFGQAMFSSRTALPFFI